MFYYYFHFLNRKLKFKVTVSKSTAHGGETRFKSKQSDSNITYALRVKVYEGEKII